MPAFSQFPEGIVNHDGKRLLNRVVLVFSLNPEGGNVDKTFITNPVHITPDSALSVPRNLAGEAKQKAEKELEREFDRDRTRGFVVRYA